MLIALTNTLVNGVGSTFIQNVLGLAFALLLNQKLRGGALVRTVVYMPVMVSALVMGYIMYFLVQYSGGAINDILILFGKAPVDFLADSTRAVIIITLVNSLQFCGVSMVIYMAGLQNIPSMYYEAAALDGAGSWDRFSSDWHIEDTVFENGCGVFLYDTLLHSRIAVEDTTSKYYPKEATEEFRGGLPFIPSKTF